MVYFLRNEQNRTIIECSVYNDDLSSSVDILEYTKKLLEIYTQSNFNANEFANDISELSEIRGAWFEKEMEFGNSKSIDDFVKKTFIKVAEKWNLRYVTD